MGSLDVRGSGGRVPSRAAGVRAVAALLMATVPLSGCYRLAPLEGADPTPSARVLVRLTDQGAVDLAPLVGSGAEALDGTLEAVRADTLDLLVRLVERRGGGFTTRPGDYVAVPRAAVRSVEERRLDRQRSWLLAGAIVAGAVILGRVIGYGTIFSGGGGDGGPVPPQ